MTLSHLYSLFWLCVAFVVYTYVLYPGLMAVMARIRSQAVLTKGTFSGSISLVLAVYNEEDLIVQRLDELCGILIASKLNGEIIVVSDGSTDDTVGLARSDRSGLVRIVELSTNVGKAAALTAGCASAKGDILVFADARQKWAANALENLLKRFLSPDVGAVGGELIIAAGAGVLEGVGLYWRYEKWLRRNEGRVSSTVGVSGAISAVRRNLFRPIPGGTLVDDVYWPLRVTMQGYRVVYEDTAHAYDKLPEQMGSEFQRKVRTLSGNFQLLSQLPTALSPWHNPIWLQFLSHKVFRLVVPWALLIMLITGALIPGVFYRLAFCAQILLYVIGLSAIFLRLPSQWTIASSAGSFLVLNAAAWCGFWVWATGGAGRSWRKARYAKGHRERAGN